MPPAAPSTASVSPGLSRARSFGTWPGGAIGDGHAGRAFEVEVDGELHELVGADRDPLARRPIGAIAEHPVAGRKAGHARAHALDRAGELAAGRERERRLLLVAPGNHQRVVEIEPDRGDAHHRLARAGAGLVDVGQDEVVGRTEAGAEDRFHGRYRGSGVGGSFLITGSPTARAGISQRFLPRLEAAIRRAIEVRVSSGGRYPRQPAAPLRRLHIAEFARYSMALKWTSWGMTEEGRSLNSNIVGRDSPWPSWRSRLRP